MFELSIHLVSARQQVLAPAPKSAIIYGSGFFCRRPWVRYAGKGTMFTVTGIARHVFLRIRVRERCNFCFTEIRRPAFSPATIPYTQKTPPELLGRCYIFISYYRFVYSIRLLSTSRATSLPSLIAHTTSDCPLRTSPAAKTFFTFV